MKRNLLKRIGAVALAVAVSLTMGTAAFAADTSSETPSGTDVSKAQAINEVSFKKTLRLIDTTTTGITLYAPAITYQYTIANSLTAAELAYDTTKGTTGDLDSAYQTKDKKLSEAVTVKDGKQGTKVPTLSLGNDPTIAFSSTDTAAAASGGALITKKLDMTVAVGQATAGVYRFKITETVASGSKTRAQAGVTQSSSYADTRFVDVYIGYNDATPAALVVKNVVMFRVDGSNVTKTEGWTSPNDLDSYETVDVTTTKNITGTMADKTHDFPFSFTVSDPSTGSLYSYKTTDGSLVSGASFGTAVNDNYTAGLSLSDTDQLVIYGVPKNAATKSTVTVSEKNDTDDAYMYKATGSFASPDSDYVDFSSTTKASAAKATSGVTADITDLAFENHLDQISPTNVVMRFAPYLFILGAAIVLLVLMRRRRASQDAE